ncbi:hypothetical protein H5U98_28800 [Mycolicibacterium boenickei]|uniref:Uncharacterized protein n=1 Tax=Mycolicibacterium boenickei TaxID=146017 RepID=A0AAX2ZW79_9MYCO|nr:hypothetical protein [Mycolicibacterium boenickei]PEG59801.1 hypothetical protein CQY21_16295 [Mycolicibacterium boenickei]UNB99416.1 hypothetical protein H5U98_28800 [Mycolicibacterium boenickei]BBX89056.1 hypothetical protein MBOE_07050 [Mycolicibacterium boenickei]
MTSPWGGLDAATADGKLYLHLEPDAVTNLETTAFKPYEEKLQAIIDNALDDTTGYFGANEKNELAKAMETAFNAKGKALTDYVREQLAQTQDFIKTAHDAAKALKENEAD